MKASEVIDTAARLLLDGDHTYWSEPELVDYLAEAQWELVALKPSAVAVTESLQLVAGIQQTLPDGAYFLIDVVRNRGISGNDAGPAITRVAMADMDRMMPDWGQRPANRSVQHYMYDPRDRSVFYVFPAQPTAPGLVEAVYAPRPEAPTDANSDLLAPTEYRAPLVDYVLYRAHTKDSQAAAPQRGMAHYERFTQALGQGRQIQYQTAGGVHGESRGSQ